MAPAEVFGDLVPDGVLELRLRQDSPSGGAGGALDEENHLFCWIGVLSVDPLLTDYDGVDDRFAKSGFSKDAVDFRTAKADAGGVQNAVTVR